MILLAFELDNPLLLGFKMILARATSVYSDNKNPRYILGCQIFTVTSLNPYI